MSESVKEMEEELICPYKEDGLYGVLYRPQIVGKRLPCFILSHGMYSSWQMTAPSARELAKLGYACYCFDFRGCSYSNKSGGDLRHCSVLTEQAELNAVIDWIRGQDFVDPKRIYLLGQSLGGVVSALTGTQRLDELAGMALMYPAFNLHDDVAAMFPSPDAIPDVVENFLNVPGLNLGRMFFTDTLRAPFAESIRAFTKPVLILHGTQDILVNHSVGEKTAKEYPNARFISVPGAEHGFNLTAEQAAEVYSFFTTRR
jgi:pimeloyl-ACP methyl ester carboxylesterase